MGEPDHYLAPLSALPPALPRMPCVVLAHNERPILPEFLRHYREIGVDRFYVVDDRSTDSSRDYLDDQPDVTTFTPVEGSTYRRDKRFWRAQLLDQHCDGAWVVVPDVDEHLVYPDVDRGRDLLSLIRSLEDEGAEAIHATMLDMYCDRPLQDHRYESGRLIDSFPLFDGPDHSFRMAVSFKTRLRMPTPGAFAFGGMRQRLFEPLPIGPGTKEARILRAYCDIGGDFSPTGLARIKLSWARLLLRGMLHSHVVYNCSKLPLLKWRKGTMFHGGAHAVSQPLRLSHQRAAMLHFKFAAGAEGLRYNSMRGQHANGADLYKRIVAKMDGSTSPAFEGSQIYQTTGSLGRFVR